MSDSIMIKCDTNAVSDGYHTFGELYEHRIELWLALCRELSASREEGDCMPWRSSLHSDGTSVNGWFVLGVGYEPGNQKTYHLPDSYWARCGFARTLAKAPEFDGHTPAEVLERLRAL